jgi:beta propeller repeat protein
MKSLLCSMMLLVLLSSARSQSPTVTVSVLDTSTQFSLLPTISGRTVALDDYRASSYSLHTIDIDTKVEQFRTHTGYTEPQIRMWGNRVVWVGYPSTTQADVYEFDLTSNLTFRVTNDTAFQNYPDIQGERIVWQDYRNTPTTNAKNADIYMYDFTTGMTRQITTDTAYQSFPAIWGNRIVWQDYRNAAVDTLNADIYMYDVSTDQEVQITTDSSYQTYPDIWEDRIVWEDFRNGTGDIYLYDLATHSERPISTYPAYKTHPVIYRDWIVWQDYRNGSTQADIYGYYLGLDQEFPLIVQGDHQDLPQLDSNNVVWQDYRNARQDLYLATLVFPPTVIVTAPNGGESWYAGSQKQVTWKYADVDSVKIEYSTDGGTAWSTVASALPARTRSYLWTVPNTPTAQARVRITDISHPGANDSSDAFFTINPPPPTVAVTSPNGGEAWMANSAHAVSWAPTTVPLLRIEYSTDAGSNWILIHDSVASAAGSFDWLIPSPTTLRALVRISDVSDPGIQDASDQLFAILRTDSVAVKGDWEMVSVPLAVLDGSKTALFPTAISPAFGYQGAYQVRDSLGTGVGYWLKFDAPQVVSITGAEVSTDSTPVTAGWNMIGAISVPVAAAAVTTDPAGIIVSQFFGYDGTYAVADTLYPGKGYWVKVNQNGTIVRSR